MLAWAVGEVYYSVFYADLAEPPLPGVSDGLWLAFYPACYVAIVLLVRERVRAVPPEPLARRARGRARRAGDRRRPGLRRARRQAGAQRRRVAVDLSYALGDLLLLGFVVAVFALTGWRPGRALAAGRRRPRDERGRRRLLPLRVGDRTVPSTRRSWPRCGPLGARARLRRLVKPAEAPAGPLRGLARAR